jgi:hypothetical protein
VLPCLSGLIAAPASAEPIADWLRLVTQCSSGKVPLRLGVVGFEPGALPPSAAESVRLSIQTDLSRSPGVETAAVRDAELLRDLQEDVLGRVPSTVIGKQLHDAFLQVDALVFFKGPVRTGSGDRVRFRLLAVLPDKLGCAPPSDEIERPLPMTPALQALDTTLAETVEHMMDVRDPAVTDVTVCPFENVGEKFSSCAPVLTDLVLQHLDKARRSRSAAFTNRILSIKRAEPGRCMAADTSAYGSIGAEGDGKRLWMKLEFIRGGAILTTTGRTQVYPLELGCDAQLRTFFEHVRADAHVAETKLSMRTTKREFARQENLAIDITAGADLSLYCWILAKDRTAYLALPILGHEDRARITSGRTLRYPGRDFDTNPIRLENPSEDLFGCFGSERSLPPEVQRSWMDLGGPTSTGAPIEVKRDDILRLLEMMRAQPGIVEAYAPVVVR